MTSNVRCSICHTRIETAEANVACPECAQTYHRECWDELGGCATYACPRAAEAQKPAPANLEGWKAWGDEKPCPVCSRTLASGALVCPCGARFPGVEPMTRAEYQKWSRGRSRARGTRVTILVLTLLTLLGIPAPVLGPVAGAIAWRHRATLAGADGTYLAMAYGAAALGVLNTLFLVALLAGA